MSEEEIVELCAKAQHEVAHIYGYATGSPTPSALDLTWGEMEEDLQGVARALVEHILKGERDPARLQAFWVGQMLSIGWIWGPHLLRKEHPWLVSFEDLPPYQRVRMELVISVTLGVASRYGLLV